MKEEGAKVLGTNSGRGAATSSDDLTDMRIHGPADGAMNAHAGKLVRDSIIWTHLAGDATQRLKVIRRLAR